MQRMEERARVLKSVLQTVHWVAVESSSSSPARFLLRLACTCTLRAVCDRPIGATAVGSAAATPSHRLTDVHAVKSFCAMRSLADRLRAYSEPTCALANVVVMRRVCGFMVSHVFSRRSCPWRTMLKTSILLASSQYLTSTIGRKTGFEHGVPFASRNLHVYGTPPAVLPYVETKNWLFLDLEYL